MTLRPMQDMYGRYRGAADQLREVRVHAHKAGHQHHRAAVSTGDAYPVVDGGHPQREPVHGPERFLPDGRHRGPGTRFNGHRAVVADSCGNHDLTCLQIDRRTIPEVGCLKRVNGR
jgi:hypothetical protein